MSFFVIKTIIAGILFIAGLFALLTMLSLMGKTERKVSPKSLRRLHKISGFIFTEQLSRSEILGGSRRPALHKGGLPWCAGSWPAHHPHPENSHRPVLQAISQVRSGHGDNGLCFNLCRLQPLSRLLPLENDLRPTRDFRVDDALSSFLKGKQRKRSFTLHQ